MSLLQFFSFLLVILDGVCYCMVSLRWGLLLHEYFVLGGAVEGGYGQAGVADV